MTRTPAEEWELIVARRRDLVVRAFRLALRCYENNGFGEAQYLCDLLKAEDLLAQDLKAFVAGRVEAARDPAANGKPPAGTPPATTPSAKGPTR